MQRILRDLSDKLGLADAIEICRRWGGRRIRIPVSVTQGDPLALTMGFESARRIVEAYGGQTLDLPAERNALLALRNEAILKAIAPKEKGGQGMTHQDAGLLYGITRQQVGNIAKAFASSAPAAGQENARA